jgi:hypothetical protein
MFMPFSMAVFIAGAITATAAFTIHVAFSHVISIHLLMAQLIFTAHQLHFGLGTRLLHRGVVIFGEIACLYSSASEQ